MPVRGLYRAVRRGRMSAIDVGRPANDEAYYFPSAESRFLSKYKLRLIIYRIVPRNALIGP